MPEIDLVNPTPLFHLFIPTEEKITSLRKHLIEDYLYVSDEARNDEAVNQTILRMFHQPNAIYYEIGDWKGVCGFRDIIPCKSAHATFKFWGKDIWGKTLIREMRQTLSLFEYAFNLVRIESQTADPRIVKLTSMVGFEVEGTRRKAFIFDGKFYDLILLGRVKEG